MTVSVELDPFIEAGVEEEAKRLGITKSDSIGDGTSGGRTFTAANGSRKTGITIRIQIKNPNAVP